MKKNKIIIVGSIVLIAVLTLFIKYNKKNTLENIQHSIVKISCDDAKWLAKNLVIIGEQTLSKLNEYEMQEWTPELLENLKDSFEKNPSEEKVQIDKWLKRVDNQMTKKFGENAPEFKILENQYSHIYMNTLNKISGIMSEEEMFKNICLAND